MTLRLRDRIEGDLVLEVAFTESAHDVGDRAEEAVRRASLDAVAEATGAVPVVMRQVHGAAVCDVTAADVDEPPTCDAMVTGAVDVALLARAADCVPVLLGDPYTGIAAAIHAGRIGLATGVVSATVARMRARGAHRISAWVGPHVCGDCYEVPEQMRAEVASLVPQARSTTSWGTPALDLGAGVRAQLAAAGVTSVRTIDRCTREDADFPSYRRDRERATRFAGVVWMHR